MDYSEIVADVLNEAAKSVPSGKRTNIVTLIRRDFEKLGYCDHALIATIEELIRKRLGKCTLEEKHSVWESLKAAGATIGETDHFEDYEEGCAEMTLETELLCFITDELSPRERRKGDLECDEK